MNLAEASQIAQIVGSAAVVASLIFVGFQIRQNTKATRAASHHEVSVALNWINLLWARSGEVSHIWIAGLSERGALTPQERWRFDSMVRAYLHICETMYIQAGLGSGDFGIVMAEENGIKTLFASDGARQWWAENPFGFSPEFRQYIDRLTTP